MDLEKRILIREKEEKAAAKTFEPIKRSREELIDQYGSKCIKCYNYTTYIIKDELYRNNKIVYCCHHCF